MIHKFTTRRRTDETQSRPANASRYSSAKHLHHRSRVCEKHPSPHVQVSPNGKGDFTTIQAALDAAPVTGEVILIAPGTYSEKLNVSKTDIWLVGMGKTPADVVLTFEDSAQTYSSTTKSASVTATGDGFEAENLTFANGWEINHQGNGGQAVALLVSGDRALFDRVRFLGAQDTLYANSHTCHGPFTGSCSASRQYFQDCFIEGHVDYIFGDGKAVFQNCELHALQHGAVTITAQSRNSSREDSGYTFLHCKITADQGVGRLFLGRPWRDYSTVTFFDTEMDARVDADGWSEWGGRLKTSTYLEYRSHGPGANGTKRIVEYPPMKPGDEKRLSPSALLVGSTPWDPEADTLVLRRILEDAKVRTQSINSGKSRQREQVSRAAL